MLEKSGRTFNYGMAERVWLLKACFVSLCVFALTVILLMQTGTIQQHAASTYAFPPFTCKSTSPDRIKTWSRGWGGLVTRLYPPVEADCQLLQAGNRGEQKRVAAQLKKWNNSETLDEFYSKLSECVYVRELFSSDNFYVSESEQTFPLAFVLLFHNSPQQIVRFLRVIYRSHNIYCLHPAGNTDKKLISAFRRLASCLDNVFVPEDLVNVTYRHFSMVDAQLKCFWYLTHVYEDTKWKYANVLCGKELPFNSNRVLVDTLREMNGNSIVNAYKIPKEALERRFTYHWKVRKGRLVPVGPRKDQVPFGVEIYKSINYISASREFVNFLLNSTKVKAIRGYMYTALMPDEEFFATSYMLPEAPRSDPPQQKIHLVKTFFLANQPNRKCVSRAMHTSCILCVHDIPLLYEYERNSGDTIIFYNKYLMEYDHVVMDCMEKRIVEQNRLEYERDCSNK